jgi:glucose-1-phosphate cytidylyltransferase
VIKEYFTNYFRHESDLRVDLSTGDTHVLAPRTEGWTVTLADTGIDSMTGGRLKRLAPLLGDRFLLTYGDGLSDVPIDAVIRHHEAQDALATITAVSPPPRFGALELSDGKVSRFREKPDDHGARINGGFFVVEPDVLDLVEDDATVFEDGPLTTLAAQGRLAAYEHDGFWMPMDTLRERDELDALAQTPRPPWVRG